MTPRYDLHTHTWHSDGTLSPAELVDRAHRQGVTVLAVTDHDVTDGIPSARDAADAIGMTLIPGVEISVTWQARTVHVVGLNIDPHNEALQAGLERLRALRLWRAREIGRRLDRHRISGAYEGAARGARGAVVSRVHFARFLVEQGHATNMRQAFKRYLGDGARAHVPSRWAELHEAIDWIRNAGGQAVLAHPARYILNRRNLRRLLVDFRNGGGVAVEVVSGCHTPQENQRFGALAREHGLLASVGSDYHGPEKPWVELGQGPALPSDCTPVWRDW
jgi:hypothetical protein